MKTVLNVGIIGAGAISGIYLDNMTNKFSNIRPVAICANHIEKAQIKASEYGIKAYTLDDMLKDENVDLCVCLTPVDMHFEIIRKVLNSGKHAYTEKTISQTTEQARELLDIADSKKLYLGSAPDTFLGAAVQTAKKAIDDKIIGEVKSFNISINRNNDILTAKFPFLSMPGAGALRDYQVYYLTALLSILGPVKRTCAFIDAPYKTRENKIPNTMYYGHTIDTPNESIVSAIIELQNGIVGTIHQNHESINCDRSMFEIYGKDGILKLANPNYFGGEIKIVKDISCIENEDLPAVETVLDPVNNYSENSRGLGVSEMAAAIIEGRKNRASKELAFHVLDVLESMEQSSQTNSMKTISSSFEIPELFC